jgi:hypothetical protein
MCTGLNTVATLGFRSRIMVISRQQVEAIFESKQNGPPKHKAGKRQVVMRNEVLMQYE